MNIVRQILKAKGDGIWTIGPRATVFEALRLMADKKVGALVVVENGLVIGILSERDYARKVVLEGKSSKDTPVSEIMTERVIGVTPATTVQECMALMTEMHIRHLPVMERGQLMGVISIGDVVKSIMSEQEYLIEHLENYIIGR
jgi:CBS domain-containing protein